MKVKAFFIVNKKVANNCDLTKVGEFPSYTIPILCKAQSEILT